MTAIDDHQEDIGAVAGVAGRGREEASNSGLSLERRFFNAKTAISFVVAFAIIIFAFSSIHVDVGDILAHLRQANIGLYLLALVVYYLSFPVRALRWRLLLANVGYSRHDDPRFPSVAGLGEIIFISWFANCLVPAKLGDAYRGYLLRRNTNVSFSRTMGTVLAERIVDMLVLFVLMCGSALAIFGPHLPGAVSYLFVVGLVLAVVVVVALFAMKRFGSHVERLLPKRVREIYVRFSEGTLLSFRNVPLLLLLTIAVWAIEAARLLLILWALGMFGISVPAVVFVSLAASLLTTLPVTPAGLGLVESGMIALLLFLNSLGTVHGISESLAGSAAILDRTISYWSIVVLGAIVYLISRKK